MCLGNYALKPFVSLIENVIVFLIETFPYSVLFLNSSPGPAVLPLCVSLDESHPVLPMSVFCMSSNIMVHIYILIGITNKQTHKHLHNEGYFYSILILILNI